MQSAAHSDPVGFETLENFSEAPAVNRWLFEKITPDVRGEILEIGSGIGNISCFLLTEQTAVYLSDLREEYCCLLQKKFYGHPHLRAILTLDISRTDFKIRHADLMEKFDTVIALNVIEHIQDDLMAVENAKTLLRSGGKLIVLVPAIPGLYNSLDLHLGHFRRYTKLELKALIEKAGLQFGDCRFFNAAAIFGWWYSGSLLKEEIMTPARLRFFDRLVPLFRIFDRVVSPFAGISLIVSGIKNTS